ncbi:MAG: acyl-CoA thioesterase [Bacteroidales bacterium]|nr:acyl-CoA thioesterase [Bacteroidales bacterium]
MKSAFSQRLVKLADLNHHQTFFAGRCAEWFLESSYFAVAQYVDTKDTVLMMLHGIDWHFPIFAGDIVTYESKVVAAGRSTLTVFTKMYRSREPEKVAADGFATFSYLDENHKSKPHGIVITPENEEERRLNEAAVQILAESKERAKRKNY